VTTDELINRAMQALRAGAPAEAIAAIEAAPSAQRDNQSAQRTLAAAHAQAGDLSAAQTAIQRALALTPATTIDPATRALAGRIALDLKRPANAFVQFEALVQIAPQQMGFWRYLWDSATTTPSARRALQLGDSLKLDAAADIHVAWAMTRALADDGRVPEALALAERVVRRHPDASAAHWLWVKRLTDETPLTALPELQRVPIATVAALDPDAVDAALTVPEQYADDAAITAWRERYAVGIGALAAATAGASLTDDARKALVRHTAFRLAYHGRDDRSLQCARGDMLTALMQPLTPTRALRERSGAESLRVGFASKHIRDCTVGHYFKRFFTDLRDEHVSVHVYACGLRDAFTDEVQSRADQLAHFDDDDTALMAMANAIAGDALDVLIYPEIGMEPIIEKLAAMRLAPLQCALWGHPVTTGLPTMDVFFSAAALEPDAAQKHYRERLHLLPGLGTCYPTPPAPSALSRVELGLPASGSLVVCAQSPFKWSPDFTRAAAAILRQSPDAKLVVFDSPVASRSRVFDDYLKHFFAPEKTNIGERIIRLPQRSREDFLAVLAACDLALDTFGFSGGNTSLDALSVGLPVVTLPGEFMRGRQTFAMLRALHTDICDSLIAADEADFIDRATGLLRDTPARSRLRAGIANQVHKLFDDPAPVEALRRWLRGSHARQN
jgi:predicted O-linked N-acetylglucosamine transferase (SPINDLY family)